MPADRRPFTIFWTAVIVDVFALGVAWSAWKSPEATPVSVVVAVAATLVCAAATVVAGRILVVISRATSRREDTRRAR